MRTRIPISALLIALALIFSYIEVLIPFNFGVPGFKLGLANLVILVALYILGPWYAIVINIMRVLLSAFLFSGVGSLMFALTGGTLSVLVMILLKKAGPFSTVGVSIGGAATHNIGQVLVAGLVISNMKIFLYLPLLLVAAVFTGTINGLVGAIIIKRLPKQILPSKQTASTVVALLLCFSLTLSLTACSSSVDNEPVSKSDFMLDTVCTISIYDKEESEAEEIIDEAFSLCNSYEGQLSKTTHESEISKINDAKGKPVAISSEAAFVINKALKYSKEYNGFDITIGEVTALWDFTAEDDGKIPTLPKDSDIKEALKSVDYKNIKITVGKEGPNDPNPARSITLNNPNTQIDLGSIAKGYIADKIADFLKENDVKSALINFGGNVVTVGEKPDETPWIVGIENPNYEDEDDEPVLGQLEVGAEQSVVTSGTYQRSFELDGTNYHHILDSKTGYPVKTDLSSATIITDESIDGDAISTICILMGHDKAYEYLKQKGIKGVLVKSDGDITALPGTNISY